MGDGDVVRSEIYRRFYPILPTAAWIERLVPLGIGLVQLRLKSDDAREVQRQVSSSLAICATHGCELVVNDHWQAAIDAGASHVHLGQEDLATADLDAIAKAGLRLDISTHTDAELDIALAAKPSAVALGPIYPTRGKDVGHGPQGLDQIKRWRQRVGRLPLIAIGGITLERAAGVIAAGADSIAVITDVTGNDNPEARVREWLAWDAAS